MRLLRGRAPNVERLEQGGKAAALLRALAYEDPVTDRDGRTVDLGAETRVQAAAALSRLDDPRVVEGLVVALADPEEAVRNAAVRGLSERAGEATIDPLVDVVADWSGSDRVVARNTAADAIVAMGEPQIALQVVARMMARAAELDEADRAIAARVVRAAGDAVRDAVAALVDDLRQDERSARARSMLVVLAPESVSSLIGALDDPRTRHDAALALGSTHSSEAVQRLSTLMLSDDDPQTRRAAAWALGEIRDPAAVEALLLASRDREFGVRSEAIDSFDKLGNAAVALAVGSLVGPALEAGRRPDGELPRAAAEAQPPEPPAPVGRTMIRRLLG